MDMKKKLEETYMPEREGRKKRIIVGLSGGINSFVSAYLLKIQKYELMAVTVVPAWENFSGKQSDVLSCHLDQAQLDAIKEFCHQLGIGHQVVRAGDEFSDVVVETWLANRLTGTKPSPCWNCHELRMKLLYQKMLEADAHGIATGHLAKIFHHEGHNSVYVHSSNDESHDQSDLLARMPHAFLAKLMLPLSDLQQKEIAKLAENFGLTSQPKNLKIHECLDVKHVTDEYLTANIPPKYAKTGEVFDTHENRHGDHRGIQYYQYAETLDFERHKNGDLFIAGYSMAEKKIKLAPSSHFLRQKIFLNQCTIAEETPWSEPIRGVLKNQNQEFVDCWVYPKNLSSAIVELDQKQRVLEGEIVSIYKKRGKNAKVYLVGKARYVQEETHEDDENEQPQVDYARDI